MVMQMFGEALDRLRKVTGERRVVPRVPAGEAVILPEADAPDEASAAGHRRAEPLALFITYVDAAGAPSRRRITVRQLLGKPPVMLLAFCHERGAMRHFRLDRIEEAVDPETGEVHALDALGALIEGAGFAPVDPDLRRAINVLVFLMRCDGLDHPAEWEAIDQALASYLLRFGGDDVAHAGALRMARQVAPDADDFLIGMRSFTHSDRVGDLGRWLRQSTIALIDADGQHSKEEFAWMTEVTEFLDIMRWKSGR